MLAAAAAAAAAAEQQGTMRNMFTRLLFK